MIAHASNSWYLQGGRVGLSDETQMRNKNKGCNSPIASVYMKRLLFETILEWNSNNNLKINPKIMYQVIDLHTLNSFEEMIARDA